MSNKIVQYKKGLPNYFDDEFEFAKKELISHMKNKEYYLHDRQNIYKDINISVDYSTKNLNQASFENCIFEKCNFSSASFVNSKFVNCKFLGCDLQSTNFRSSYFEQVYFDTNTIINSTRFGKSKLLFCHFDRCDMVSVILDEAEIHDTKFNNSTWYALSVDLCLFNKTTFDKIVFRNMNFEFAIFQEIHMNNMKLPFPTIPYIFGGLKYLKETNDNVFVTSQQCLSEGLSKDKYLSLLDKLEIYYKNTNNYFPLANIYLSKDQMENSKSAIILGIERALMLHDLKLIENLTRLISFNSLFNMSERYDLLNYVVSKISANHTSMELTNETNKCVFNMRTLLFNTTVNGSSLHFSIKTNIENNSRQMAGFIGVIENMISDLQKPSHYNIEIRHNSPYEFLINVFSDYESICFTLGLLCLALKGTDKILTKVMTHISSAQNIKKQHLENKKIEQELKLNEFELQQQEQDFQSRIDKATQSQKEIEQSEIITNNISYIIISNSGNQIINSSDVLN